ncbi:hypothetical protein [Variovorax sp. WS11]|uniref:hypothetical protein n=1 Tax=Variovorax sp. WS11 TaxID=1105204 RepID=UPI0011B1EF82|nr:hypothetical protein [Variovorax sp. WS11]NDZ17114.1 hypothetical protein [Variovorax sp. WS11]
MTVFAAARALGAVVSVAQGTQVALQPAGVGVNMAPGQALQPLDQLIDQFANIMLAASVSFGIQRLLLEVGCHWTVSAALSVAVLTIALLHWRNKPERLRWLQPVLVVLLVARFAVPISALGSEALYRAFMAEEYRKELAVLNASPDKVSGLKGAEPAGNESVLQRWKSKLPDLKGSYEAILAAASEWPRTMVKLIALFTLQTIVLPLVFLWLVVHLGQLAVRAPRRTSEGR